MHDDIEYAYGMWIVAAFNICLFLASATGTIVNGSCKEGAGD